MRAELKTHGLNLVGAPGFNAVTDPDGIRMQFMATPGGLLQTIIPSTRIAQDDAICEAVGLDHVVLQVPELEKWGLDPPRLCHRQPLKTIRLECMP